MTQNVLCSWDVIGELNLQETAFSSRCWNSSTVDTCWALRWVCPFLVPSEGGSCHFRRRPCRHRSHPAGRHSGDVARRCGRGTLRRAAGQLTFRTLRSRCLSDREESGDSRARRIPPGLLRRLRPCPSCAVRGTRCGSVSRACGAAAPGVRAAGLLLRGGPPWESKNL